MVRLVRFQYTEPHAVLAQLVRAPACRAGSREFESPIQRQFGFAEPKFLPDSSAIEQRLDKAQVVGLIPTLATNSAVILVRAMTRRLNGRPT